MEAGVPPTPKELIEAHPDLASSLRIYLQSLDNLHDIAAGFRSLADQVDGDESETWTGFDRVQLGDFVLGPEIGRGGMGVVYEAQQLSLNRRVALKVLPFASVLDSKHVARFRNEAQAAAQLHHPHIVPIFAVGLERGVHYYAMQLIDGQPLDRAIDELRRERARPVYGAADVDFGQGQTSATGPDSPSTCRSFLTETWSTRGAYYTRGHAAGDSSRRGTARSP